MAKLQKDIFLNGEGDQYFKRNQAQSIREEPLSFYARFLKKGFRILEIGCSDGANLEYLARTRQCQCYGIDPSVSAVRSGKKKYRDLTLSVSTADVLKFPNEFFDFVLFGFCLYLVDRQTLSKVIAETDRVLKDKGFLGITDFDAKLPRKRVYRYQKGIFSYKMSYSDLFLAFPHYSFVEKISYSNTSDNFVEDITERVSSVVLFKDYAAGYFPESDEA